MVKNPLTNAADRGDSGLNPELGRSPRGGNGNLLRILAGKILWTDEVAKNGTWLSTHTSMSCFVLQARDRQRHSLFHAGTLQEFHKPVAHRAVFVVRSPSPTPFDPTDCSMPGLPVPHHLLKFAQVHVHCINDSIQPSHPLMPSSYALTLFQYQGLFQRIGCSHQVTKILKLQLQHQSFQ